eukprot:gnl/TRDRNA2_/TRDRNA2_88201_c0_seq2.p1 gnl/TRDRNA2_/TRDRNA2_88201_c0~~gnl/TRDRNA2_/TRDRNA2_88201_c0_seq2.p1  ORF type:complete len:150 (-),score=37.66 gnl/TRDRNA2_/TRDRNA2_88201_c0_seq2:87-536(-)
MAAAGASELRRREASGRVEELMVELARLAEESAAAEAAVGDADDAEAEEGEDEGEKVNPGEVTSGVVYGPYSVAAFVGGHSVALDLDAHEGPVGRALRRQQWAAVAPDVRVAEISLAHWDACGGEGRQDLLRRRILNIEDPTEDGDESD